MSRLRGKELAAFLGLAFVWSGNWLVIRIGLRDLPPFLFAGARMVIATLLLLVLVRGSAKATPGERRWIALVGLLQIGVSYGCVYTAEQWIDSGLAAVFFATFPIWIAILGHFALGNAGERLTARTSVAAVLGLAGIAVLESPALARAASERPPGLLAGGLLMIASAMASAVAAIVIKKRLPHVPARRNTLGQAVAGGAALLAASLAVERGAPVRWTPSAAAAVIYLGIVGTLIFVGSQWLVPRVSVAVVGAFPIVNTLLAVLWGAALAKEPVTARGAVATALILAGVVLATGAGVRPPSPSARPGPLAPAGSA